MKILFQGDSITDAGRDRAKPEHLGGGYPHFTAGVLDFDYPAFEQRWKNGRQFPKNWKKNTIVPLWTCKLLAAR